MSVNQKGLDIGQNIANLVYDVEPFQGRLFNKNIAESINISEAAYSKKLNGESPFTVEDIKKLVEFFNNIYKTHSKDTQITADDLIYGCHTEKEDLRIDCLDTSSRKWLDSISSGDNDEYKKMLNIILSKNWNLCERFLAIALYYCYSGFLCVYSPTKDNEPLNSEISEKMIRGLAINDMAELLSDISNIWNERYVKENAKFLAKFRGDKLSSNNRKIIMHKLRTNHRYDHGIPTTTELIRRVHELREREK